MTEKREQWPNHEKPVAGRVTFANGEAFEYTDPTEFLKVVQEELPYHPTSGFRYEVLTRNPNIRKAADDIPYDLYGKDNPRRLEDYQDLPAMAMTM